jgi:hypothetical protein
MVDSDCSKGLGEYCFFSSETGQIEATLMLVDVAGMSHTLEVLNKRLAYFTKATKIGVLKY